MGRTTTCPGFASPSSSVSLNASTIMRILCGVIVNLHSHTSNEQQASKIETTNGIARSHGLKFPEVVSHLPDECTDGSRSVTNWVQRRRRERLSGHTSLSRVGGRRRRSCGCRRASYGVRSESRSRWCCSCRRVGVLMRVRGQPWLMAGEGGISYSCWRTLRARFGFHEFGGLVASREISS